MPAARNQIPEPRLTEAALARLTPLSALRRAENLRLLLAKVRCEELPSRRKLRQADERNWLIYVLVGEVQVQRSGAGEESVRAGTTRANAPLFRDGGATAIALARGRARIARIDRALAQVLLGQERATAAEVEEVALSPCESRILEDIYAAFAARQLRIPALPDVALKVRDAVNRDHHGTADVARILQSDPVLAGRLMQAANSALHRGVQPARTLTEAINRLGLNATRTLAVALALREVFRIKHAQIAKLARQLYNHSAQVAALCHAMAREHTTLAPEQALLAGLLHDLGAIPVLDFAARDADIAARSSVVLRAMARLRAPVGALVLSNWGFDEALVQAAEHAEDWLREGAAEPDLCDLVIAAHLFLAQQAGNADTPSLDETPVGRKLGAELPATLLNEAAAAIAAARDLLST